jgi:hypothetical protein
MFSLFGLTLFVCFLVGTAVVVALTVRAGGISRTGGSIARVLYEAEHTEKTR